MEIQIDWLFDDGSLIVHYGESDVVVFAAVSREEDLEALENDLLSFFERSFLLPLIGENWHAEVSCEAGQGIVLVEVVPEMVDSTDVPFPLLIASEHERIEVGVHVVPCTIAELCEVVSILRDGVLDAIIVIGVLLFEATKSSDCLLEITVLTGSCNDHVVGDLFDTVDVLELYMTGQRYLGCFHS